MNFSRRNYPIIQKQRGAAFIVMLVILIMGITAYLVGSLSSSALQFKRDEITADALAQAKEALIGRAASDSNMPGQLPCPEDTSLIGYPNEGQALTNCSLPAIGRLPWRTLGLGDLRDGNGDKLWYAISAGFRTSPLSSDTQAQLTVDLVPNKAVAIIFSPGVPIAGQSRPLPTSGSPPAIAQYLELSNNTGSNAFVSTGPTGTFNDKLLLVSHDDLFRVVERRVVKEVINALNEFYCGFGNVSSTGGCTLPSGGNRYYPAPADFTDQSCLGYLDISSNCYSGASNKGRIPANPLSNAWDPTSILLGVSVGNWFQSNAWREVIYYAVAPACINGTINCTIGTFLTLNNPPITVIGNQKVVVIASGSALSTTTPAQTRTNNSLKTSLNNYLEDENLVPLDDIYTKHVANPSIPFNDIATSIP